MRLSAQDHMTGMPTRNAQRPVSSKSEAQNAQLKSKIEEAVFFGAMEEVGGPCLLQIMPS